MDEQRAGRQLHRYRSKLAAQAKLLRDCRAALEACYDASEDGPDNPMMQTIGTLLKRIDDSSSERSNRT